MSINTIEHTDLHDAVLDMTGSVDIVEATFTPWDEDQSAELEALLTTLNGLDRLDTAVLAAA